MRTVPVPSSIEMPVIAVEHGLFLGEGQWPIGTMVTPAVAADVAAMLNAYRLPPEPKPFVDPESLVLAYAINRFVTVKRESFAANYKLVMTDPDSPAYPEIHATAVELEAASSRAWEAMRAAYMGYDQAVTDLIAAHR